MHYLPLLLIFASLSSHLQTQLRSYCTHELIESARHARIVETECLLNLCVDPNLAIQNGVTALHAAAESGDLATAKILLRHGATVDAKDINGWTPLTLASSIEESSMVQQLLSAGANVDLKDKHGLTPLFWCVLNSDERAASIDTAKLLLDHGADPNRDFELQEPCLICAVSIGNQRMTELLIANGADVAKADHSGRFPLDFASKPGIIKLLDEHRASGRKRTRGT